MAFLYNSSNRKTLRQKLRNHLGLPEILLWRQLKSSQLGYKFRRQYGVGRYSLDFYCPEVRLGVELDGNTHDNPASMRSDDERTNFINQQGISIIRFQNKEVLSNLEGVIVEIKKYLPPRHPAGATPPVSGGELR